MSLLVPSAEMRRSIEMLHREFFQQIDPTVFAECQEPGFQSRQPLSTFTEPCETAARTGTARRFRPLTIISQN
jgi:hypothetical protein